MAELPELPWDTGYMDYTAAQVREFMRSAVLMERERCAKIADAEHFGGQHDDDLSWTGCAAHIAAAIRGQAEGRE